MKAVELEVLQQDDWRKISIALIDAKKGEQTAQACANACPSTVAANTIESPAS
jgi:hypothetical protein